jgi:hypothetical protein
MHTRRFPIDLSATMAVCDANYIRLLKLFPDFSRESCRAFALPAVGSAIEGDHVVVLEIIETFKYTSTLSIRLSVPGSLTGSAAQYYRPPVMLVRLYHDASTAEVISYQNQRDTRNLYPDEEVPRYYPDEKEQINLFLAEWLILCLESGLGLAAMLASPRAIAGLIPSA